MSASGSLRHFDSHIATAANQAVGVASREEAGGAIDKLWLRSSKGSLNGNQYLLVRIEGEIIDGEPICDILRANGRQQKQYKQKSSHLREAEKKVDNQKGC